MFSFLFSQEWITQWTGCLVIFVCLSQMTVHYWTEMHYYSQNHYFCEPQNSHCHCLHKKNLKTIINHCRRLASQQLFIKLTSFPVFPVWLSFTFLYSTLSLCFQSSGWWFSQASFIPREPFQTLPYSFYSPQIRPVHHCHSTVLLSLMFCNWSTAMFLWI